MNWEEKTAFYEQQQSSWAYVRELCEASASRVTDTERLERIRAALQLAANLENDASAMLRRLRPPETQR